MKILRLLFPMMLCFTGFLRSQQGPSPQSAIYITHVTVIDTQAGREYSDETVVISGSRIKSISGSKRVRTPQSAQVVDGTRKYLIPGLWDMHVHAIRKERIDAMFPMFVANGVLGIRDMGTEMPLEDVDAVRQQVASGTRLGPRLITTGQILDGRIPPMAKNFAVITTEAAGRAAVQALKAGGADFVKVYTWLPKDAYLAIADESKRQGIPFVGHVPMYVTALEASALGQKSIEHLNGIDLVCSAREDEIRAALPKSADETSNAAGKKAIAEASASYSAEKCSRAIATLAQNHTWQVPTFMAFFQDAELNDSRFTQDVRLKYLPSSVRKQWSDYAGHNNSPTPMTQIYARHLEILGAMHRAGVPIMAGTDSAWAVPFTYAGFTLHDELAQLVRAGLSPRDALRAATINPARFLGMEKDLGTIEVGKIADLVLLEGDPLQEIHNTTRIRAVFQSGKYYDRSALDKMLRDAEAAANSSGDVSIRIH